MKNFAIIAFTLNWCIAQTQITVTNISFPAIGDTLTTSIDMDFSSFDPSQDGANIVWDFSELSSSSTTSQYVFAASQGSGSEDFPNANLLFKSENDVEIYYKKESNQIIELGRLGLDPVLEAVYVDLVVQGTQTFMRAPLNFEDSFAEAHSFDITISTSELPDSILSLLGSFASSINAIRIQVDVDVHENVDAWGQLLLHNKTYEVLRLRQTSFMTTNIEVEIFGSWVDVNDLPVALPDYIQSLIEPRESINYRFISNEEIGYLVEVSVDSLGVVDRVQYLDNRVNTNTNDSYSSLSKFTAYPNPTFGVVTFSIENVPNDTYRIEVLDVLGRKVWTKNTLKNQNLIRADLSNLKRGTYMYRIYDNRGRKLVTKRLMIIRP